MSIPDPSCAPPAARVSLRVQAHQVDVWRIRLLKAYASLDRLESTLSPAEKERAGRFRFPEHREQFIVSHGCLREILAGYLGCSPARLGFRVNAHGKPALVEQALEFSLSHSGALALVAVTRGARVGVDVEQIRGGLSSETIARQYFSGAEVADLEALPAEERETAFFSCWTRKEAYIKARGLGLSLPLDSFDVSLAPGEPAALRATRPDPAEAARWILASLAVGAGYTAAVVAEGRHIEVRLRDWDAGLIL